MKKLTAIFVCAATLMLANCEQAIQILDISSVRALVNGPEGVYATAYRGTFYCGSQDGFDIFCINRDFLIDDNIFFRVQEQESPVTKRKPFSRRKSNWVDVSVLFTENASHTATPTRD